MGIGIPSAPGVGNQPLLPKMLATNSAGQSIGSGATATTTNWTLSYDTHGGFTASTGVYTVPYTGFYQISWSLGGLTTSATVFATRARLVNAAGGTFDAYVSIPAVTASTVPVGQSTSICLRLQKGNTITLQAVNGGPNALTLDTGGTLCWWSINMTND